MVNKLESQDYTGLSFKVEGVRSLESSVEQTNACREPGLNFIANDAPAGSRTESWLLATDRRFLLLAVLCVLMHAGFMLYHYGQLPVPPFMGDEIVINDPAVSLARGHGYVAASFAGSHLGMDRVFAHFPPLYPLMTAGVFRLLGVSVYTLRLTTTVMSIASTILLATFLLYLRRSGFISREVALLVLAIDCSTASLISLERVARMESTLSSVVLVGLFSLFVAAQRGAKGPIFWPSVITIAAAAAGLGVHPEAISAVVLFAGIAVVAIPGHLRAKLLALSVILLLPILFLGAFFGKQSVAASHQFVTIFLHRIPDMTFLQWLQQISHPGNIARSRDPFLLLEIVLLLTAPLVYVLALKSWRGPESLRRRLLLGLCLGALAEWMLLLFFLHAGVHRYQFLFGPLLLLNAICLLGSAPLRRWKSYAGWAFVVVNVGVTFAYLSHPRFSAADRNPERFQDVIRRLPISAHIAASPALWLDLVEDGRSFSCLYTGLDGERQWQRTSQNPLQQFDAVVLSSGDNNRRLREEAAQGKDKYVFMIGSNSVEVYLREGMQLTP